MKIDIREQVATMKAIMVAEELRQRAAIARGEITEDQANDHLTRVQAALGTLEYLQENKRDFLDFVAAQKVQAGR